MKSRIIATAINGNPHYVEGLKVFLRSLVKNAPEESVYVSLTNVKEKDVSEISSIGKNISINIQNMNEGDNDCLVNYNRHEILLSLIDSFNMVAWIDNDAIVRGSLDGIWSDVDENTLKIWYRKYYHDNPKKRNRPECFFQGGVYVVGNGSPIRKWLVEIIDNLKNTKDWFLPQALLYVKWYENKKKIRHVQLDEAYNDSKFRDKSIIWHCKQPGFNNSEYQKEYVKYL